MKYKNLSVPGQLYWLTTGLDSGKDSKLDSWFLFDSYKQKQNLMTEVQEPVSRNVTNVTYKILHRNT